MEVPRGSDPATRPRIGPRSVVGFVAKLSLAGIILVWLFWSGRIDAARLLGLTLSWQLLAVCLLVPLAMFLPALRWWFLLRSQKLSVSMGKAIRLTWVAYFATLFLPGSTGGDVAKAYLVVKNRTSGRLRALSTVLVDRVIGLYSLLLLGMIAAAWSLLQDPSNAIVQTIAGSVLLLLVAVTGVMLLAVWASRRNRRLPIVPDRWNQSIRDALSSYRQSKATLIGCLGLSLVSHSLLLLGLAAAAGTLALAIPLATVFQVGPLVLIANCLPITPGGAGVGEAASHTLFGALNFAGGGEAMVILRIAVILASVPAALLIGRQGVPE